MDLRLGDWRDVLSDVECDSLIADPPYGERTHVGHDVARQSDGSRRRKLDYGFFTPEDVAEFVESWHERTRGWMAVMSCSDLAHHYRAAFERVGRVAFAPVPCVIRGMTVRQRGDGPAVWAVWLNVARPKGLIDGARVGAYFSTRSGGEARIGGKPLSLMLTIVRDYSRYGGVVCDPFAGYGTTLRAAEGLGRIAIGAEVDRATWSKAGTF